MQNRIQLFSNENLGSVRVIANEGNPLFCLADVCRVLELTNPAQVKMSISAEFELPKLNIASFDTGFGIKEFTMITEPQLYFVLMRSDKPKAKPFRQWVCCEVLPSIRKKGDYSLNQQYKLPKTYKEALLELVRAEEEKERLLLKAKEDAPKVQCFNELMDSKNAISFADFAKIIGIGEKKLFAMCREASILMSNNIPYQKHIDADHFRVVERTFDKGKFKSSYSKTLITPKGQAYLTKKFKEVSSEVSNG